MLVKILDKGYILGLAEAPTGVEVTETEYAELTEIFHNIPVKGGYIYRLREDLTWEETIAEEEPVDELSAEETVSIIFGGAE